MTATAAPPASTTAPGASPSRPPVRRWATAAAVVVALVVGTVTGPRPPSLGAETRGDEALAEEVRTVVEDPGGLGALAVAEVTAGGELRTAGLGGADADTSFELGSIAKALTGMLLADLVDDGVVALDDTLGELLPDVAFADPDVAATTLEQLATHRSGLPRDLSGDLARRFGQQLGADPFGPLAPQDVIDAAAAAEIGERDVEYSNLGFALLGQALAEHTGTPYRELLRARVLDPLGMEDTVVVAPGEPLPAGAVPGRSPGGTLMAPWRGWGLAPAGGAVWSTAPDLGRLLAGVADGSAPGADAAEPRADYRPGSRIGLAWITTTHDDGRVLTWHNGGTSGHRTWAGFDPESGRGVAVLSATGRSVDGLGAALLGVRDGEAAGIPWPLVAVTLFLTAAGGAGVLGALPNRRGTGRTRERLGAAVAVVTALLLLWTAHLVGRWDVVPPVVWTAAAVAFTVGLVRLVDWWPRLPWTAGAPRWRRVAAAAGNAAVAVALAGYLAWASV